MTLFYFASTIQTVVPIVKQGVIQDSNDSRYLSCFRNSADCLENIKTSYDETFIILFDIPSGYQSDSLNYIYDEEDSKESILVTDHIYPQWIRKVIVRSILAETMLKELLNGELTVVIEKNSNLFINNVSLSQDLRYLEDYASSDDESIIAKSTTKMDVDSDIFSGDQLPWAFFRLTTNGEHVDHLIKEIESASEKVLITSYDISEYVFKRYNLYGVFADAVRRGVRFYLYYNDANSLSKNLKSFFNVHNIKYDQAYTHSKFLVIDNVRVAIGSYNWLSVPHRDSLNGTIFYLGESSAELAEVFWDHLRRYRALQYGQYWSVDRFDRKNDNCSCLEFDLPESSTLTYLPTLETHQDYLLSLFERAKERVIICSPFISLNLLEDINVDSLVKATSRGVLIYFVSTPATIENKDFYDFLDRFDLPNLYLSAVKNFHLKTIILDNDEIAEGSFNWLSASRDRLSDAHNHEATVVVNGPIASELIEEFFQSRVGHAVLNNETAVNAFTTNLRKFFASFK